MGERALALGLAAFLLAAAATASQAAERWPTFDLSVDGSVPLNYSDDRIRNPNGGRADYLTSPYFKVSLNGRAVPDLHYAFYASIGVDKYPSRIDSDSTASTLGASLTRRWDNFRFGVSFEQNHFYDGLFGPFLYLAHDLSMSASYLYTNDTKTLRIRPRLGASRRFTDDASQESYVVSFSIDTEYKLAKDWWWTVTPRIRYQDFLGGTNRGRQDTIYSISTGLRYTINDQVDITSSVGYQSRDSTVARRNFDSFGASISLNFSHTFGVPDAQSDSNRRGSSRWSR